MKKIEYEAKKNPYLGVCSTHSQLQLAIDYTYNEIVWRWGTPQLFTVYDHYSNIKIARHGGYTMVYPILRHNQYIISCFCIPLSGMVGSQSPLSSVNLILYPIKPHENPIH